MSSEFPPIDAAPAEAGSNAPPFLSVTELSQLLKRTVESNFDFVRVRAEISRPTRAASGHLYLPRKMSATCSTVLLEDGGRVAGCAARGRP